MIKSDKYYEVAAKKFCDLIGARGDMLIHTGNDYQLYWKHVADSFKRDDAQAEARSYAHTKVTLQGE